MQRALPAPDQAQWVLIILIGLSQNTLDCGPCCFTQHGALSRQFHRAQAVTQVLSTCCGQVAAQVSLHATKHPMSGSVRASILSWRCPCVDSELAASCTHTHTHTQHSDASCEPDRDTCSPSPLPVLHTGGSPLGPQDRSRPPPEGKTQEGPQGGIGEPCVCTGQSKGQGQPRHSGSGCDLGAEVAVDLPHTCFERDAGPATQPTCSMRASRARLASERQRGPAVPDRCRVVSHT